MTDIAALREAATAIDVGALRKLAQVTRGQAAVAAALTVALAAGAALALTPTIVNRIYPQPIDPHSIGR